MSKNFYHYFIIFIILFLFADSVMPHSFQNPEQKPDDKIKLTSSLVSLLITVTDGADRLYSGLVKDDFEVYENKVLQKIDHFSGEDTPLTIGIVYDVSGSMKEKAPKAFHALERFLQNCHEDDDLFLITFSDRARLAVNFTASPEQILSALTLAESKGSTALYDGVYLAMAKAAENTRHERKAILIISDGQDNSSRYTFSDVRAVAKESGLQIYCIGISDRSELDALGRGALEDIARMTGSRSFFPTVFTQFGVGNQGSDLENIMLRIALELRHQYSLAYYVDHSTYDGKCYKIKIKINEKARKQKHLPRLSIRFKDQYCNPLLK